MDEDASRRGKGLDRKQQQVPDVQKHLKNRARNPGQKLSFEVLDTVDLVVLVRNKFRA
jgi:hypothetical protein